MEINPIESLSISFPSLTSGIGLKMKGAAPAQGSLSSFGSTLLNAIESLDRQQIGAEREIARAVAGESPDMHKTIATLQTADLSLQLALQVRNKVIGAYEEIMRMQV